MSFLTKSKQTQTSKTELPSWVEAGSRQAVGLAQRVGSQPYSPYSAQRFAGMSGAESQAGDLTRSGVGSYQPFLSQASNMLNSAGAGANPTAAMQPHVDEAGNALRTASGMSARGAAQPYMDQAGQRFTDADMSGYMNPFIQNAMQPAMRDIGEHFAQQRTGNQAAAASAGAFGGSRHAMMDQMNYNAEGRSMGDMLSQGYASAFDRGAGLWSADQDRSMQLGSMAGSLTGADADRRVGIANQYAGLGDMAARTALADTDMRSRLASQYSGLGELTSRLQGADIDRLYATGGLERGLDQQQRDFDYDQFTEGRDWDLRNLAALTGTMGSVPTPSTTTNVTRGSGSPLGALASLGMMAFGGPLGAVAGGASLASKGGKIMQLGKGGG